MIGPFMTRRYSFATAGAILIVVICAWIVFEWGSLNKPSPRMTESERSVNETLLPGPVDATIERAIPSAQHSHERVERKQHVAPAVGVLGAPIKQLWETYSTHLELAQQGDPASQYEVSRVLFECAGLPRREVFDRLVAEARIPQAMALEIEPKLDACMRLMNEVPDLREQSARWLRASVEQGYPLALGRDLTFRPYKYTADQARDIILTVVRQPDIEVYRMVVSYLANFREDDFIAYGAWLLVSCQRNPQCDVQDFIAIELDDPRPWHLDEIQSAAKEINSALDKGLWDNLGL